MPGPFDETRGAAEAAVSKIYALDQVCVLLVEDSPYMAHLLGSMLKALRIGRVLRARGGLEAQELIDSRVSAMPGQAIDIILSDWHMEPVDGLALLKWVRAHRHENVRFLPFIMLTAAPEVNRVTLARDAGVTGFLRKPVTVDSLLPGPRNSVCFCFTMIARWTAINAPITSGTIRTCVM